MTPDLVFRGGRPTVPWAMLHVHIRASVESCMAGPLICTLGLRNHCRELKIRARKSVERGLVHWVDSQHEHNATDC